MFEKIVIILVLWVTMMSANNKNFKKCREVGKKVDF